MKRRGLDGIAGHINQALQHPGKQLFPDWIALHQLQAFEILPAESL
jgi:hypothetical protein